MVTLKELVEEFPEDAVCAFCGKKNDYYDEDGFYYLQTRPEMELGEGEAACKACVKGKPGKMHDKLHGSGNRN